MSSSTLENRPQRPEGPAEAPLTLDEPAPRVLSFWDQSAFWANLGVSLFAFSGAYTVLAPDENGVPQLSIAAGIAAMIIGTLVGGLMLGLAAVPGARTGRPAMVILRGLFGARLSYAPTVLNIAQLIGWGTFELIVIADAAHELFGGGPRWVYVLIAGVLTTALTIWPLGSVRLLRRFVTIAVGIALVWFYIQFVRAGLPDLTAHPGASGGGPFGADWSLFWLAIDAALAVSISWVPLAADYTRHARSERAAFGAASGAYAVTQIIAYTLGLFALVLAGQGGGVYGPFLTVTAGAVFFFVFVLREADQSFANVYSTALSIQNLVPRVDRRVLSVGLGALITVLALVLNMDDYYGFLALIGSVFVPLLGVLAADFFLGRGRTGWNTAPDAPARWSMVVSWLGGFVVYQLINPGQLGAWQRFWEGVQDTIGLTVQPWMSASLLSFLVAGVLALVCGRIAGRRGTD
ncbi:putative hydroxymethylpyrimidine transporter CytX [Actinocorallia herbida]|uniref:Putative hydroxymethylpyrimidine transporter CytX n=1 Tax=Actinocorallia herbida TaxID=58109 RepID=A0A3N1DB27_9ACTN|nr:cytosine permease [Actinocorallia herbida]ROO90666.1 putative hydroxymethylpyrimidine transporter CytX [Actinocorallia herbida]